MFILYRFRDITTCELTTYLTSNDLEKCYHSNSAVEVVAQAIVVISSIGDICCI